jgi:sugar phosphate isomerase/epimerase
MKLGIFAKVFEPRPIDGLFAAVAAAGYESVQFNLTCVGLPMLPVTPVPAETILEIGAAARRHGISLPAISGTFNMIHPDRAVVAEGLTGLARVGEVCLQLGIPVITLCTGTRDRESMWREHPDNHTPAAWADLVATMREALAVTPDAVSLAIEPEPANVAHAAPAARRLCDEVGHRRLGVTLDAANLIRAHSAQEDREIFDQACALLGDRVVLAHAKDRRADGTVCPAGQGAVDFPYFVERLRGIGFDGSLIAHGIDVSEAADTAEYLRGVLGRKRD